MPRRPNQLKSESITVSTTPQVKAYLEALVATGLYGKSYTEAAERLIARSVESLVRDGTLSERGRKKK